MPHKGLFLLCLWRMKATIMTNSAALLMKTVTRKVFSETAYVFGDSTNDLPMFAYAKNRVLMGKHDRELEVFDSFLTRNVEDDGIAWALKQLGLI